MLSRLYIQNYALIHQLDIAFHSGFTVITGETGAGKSILMGALSLLSGKRADVSVLNNKEEKCIVEASFQLSDKHRILFEEQELDFYNENIFRREISPSGKSRAFINDTPVTLDVLKEISAQCFDIHSQHEVFALAKPAFRMDVCDAFANIIPDVQSFKSDFKNFIQDQKKYKAFLENIEQQKAEFDYKNYLFEELQAFQYKEGEQLALEQELSLLANAGELIQTLQSSLFAIQESDNNISQQLQQIKSGLAKLAGDTGALATQNERLHSLIVELKDIGSELDNILATVQVNPQRMQEVELRLSDLYALLKKHRVNDGEELLKVQEQLSEWLHSQSSSETRLENWKNTLDKAEKNLKDRALKLRTKRKKGAEEFAKIVEGYIRDLAMPHACFLGEVKELDTMNEWGMDAVHFWFSANAGHEPVELHKSASGGEMSRVMLAIKYAITQKSQLPAIVFDEIDTGISGRVADLAGQMMQDLSHYSQVIAITHLPQIAAKGKQHFKVEKRIVQDKARTDLILLSPDKRIEELASMLSGEHLSEAAMQNARDLLGSNA